MWRVQLDAQVFASPYEPKNRLLLGETERTAKILRDDSRDEDYFIDAYGSEKNPDSWDVKTARCITVLGRR